MAIAITNTQQLPVTLAVTDSQGNPAAVQPGSVAWWANSGNVTVIPDPTNDLAAMLVATGLGQAAVSAQADANMGSGVYTISAQLVFEIIPAGDVISMTIVPGIPEPQPS